MTNDERAENVTQASSHEGLAEGAAMDLTEGGGAAVRVSPHATAHPRRLPGEEGIWVMIGGDMLVFVLFFLTFLYYRDLSPELYAHSKMSLNKMIGLINTLVLLTSSWCVASAVNQLRAGNNRLAGRVLAGAVLLGATFVALKITEYSEKIKAGISIETNEFYAFYFMLTGIHLVHVLVGSGVLIFLLLQMRGTVEHEKRVAYFESGASFWHLVDLLWVILFALLYLAE